MNEEYIIKLKFRLIRISVSASSTRNQIGAGKINNIRCAINNLLSLNRLNALTDDPLEFRKMLNYVTNILVAKTQIKWGTSRKLINICLREIVYNTYLREYLKLKEKDLFKLEVPIDSHTYKYLVDQNNFSKFRWNGIINVSKKDHLAFQKSYFDLALRNKIAAIHLDIDAW